MNEYEYEVVLKVRVKSFDPGDAWDMLQEAFGIGENCGTNVIDCEYREVK